MSESRSESSSRRDFLAGVTAGAAGFVAAACTTPGAASQAPTPQPVPSTPAASGSEAPTGFVMPMAPLNGTRWDDSWTKRLGKHRTVFDVSEIEQEPGPYQVTPIMDNYKMALGASDADLGFVLVIRHAAMGMVVNDAMWAKYDVAGGMKRQDRTTNAPFKRNPFQQVITECQKRGVIVLGCNIAMMGFTSRMARAASADVKTVRAEIVANMLPTVILLPTGLFAVARAQNVGCGYMK